VTFDLHAFPSQLTTNPDPIQGLHLWTKRRFPHVQVVGHDTFLPAWQPTGATPAIYWRFESATSGTADRQSYAVNWYTGVFMAHVMAESTDVQNQWVKVLCEQLQLDGEVPLADGSPLVVQKITLRPNAAPVCEGQISLTGAYGVPAQQRKEFLQPTLQRAHVRHEKNEMEATIYGSNV